MITDRQTSRPPTRVFGHTGSVMARQRHIGWIKIGSRADPVSFSSSMTERKAWNRVQRDCEELLREEPMISIVSCWRLSLIVCTGEGWGRDEEGKSKPSRLSFVFAPGGVD